MPPPDRISLWSSSSGVGRLSDRALWGAEASVSLGDLVDGSALDGRLQEFRDRSVLVATRDQLTAALALIELDGVASRLVLCPPDLPAEHLPYVVATAAVDAQVTDEAVPGAAAPGVEALVTCSPKITPGGCDRTPRHATEWILLTGEIADQASLDHLRACYPDARIAHAFASTEAGVAFDVGDGRAGFPASLIGPQSGSTELRVENGSLRIRSTRTATRYLGDQAETLRDADGFVDTADMLERRGDRYYFVGRRGGIINVGGLKVHPEEVEAVINAHPRVRMSLVRTRKNPITGALVVADVVLNAEADAANGRALELEQEIMRRCREVLPRHKVPAAINFVPGLTVNATGKLVRRDA